MNLQDFFEGKSFDAYRYFGAHFQIDHWIFRVYAPRALDVSLIGDFNHWHPQPMTKVHDGGIYELTVYHAHENDLYKYRIHGADGRYIDRSDPYGFETELRPHSASRLVHLERFTFHDEDWAKKQNQHYQDPLNIYEIHLGSFKRHEDGRWYRYQETASALIPYLKQNGFTHVELMPVAEHPSDESWGYQTSGFYSPTSRYGRAKDLMAFIELMHQNQIGVILDVVIVHFAVNDFALYQFDGTPLYEYDHHDTGYSEWGSYNFNYYRPDVCSFVQSSLAFWLDVYHVDGLRMDAIANAIYWQGKKERGLNEGAIHFIQKMNQGLHQKFGRVMLIAEDSTQFLKVTAPVDYEGLGFDYKWDMGWMNDTLRFFSMEPEIRQNHMELLTFSMHYFYNELYLLPLSHDEVVHGKKTMVDKMPGTYEEKFANARLLYLYMYTHPGKKLNFMGNEIAMFREFDEKRAVDWDLLTYPIHQDFARFFRDLCLIYQHHDSLYAWDYHSDFFMQLLLEDGCYGFARVSLHEQMMVIFNFTKREAVFTYQGTAKLLELLNTQWDIYHGHIKSEPKLLLSKGDVLTLPPLSGRVLMTKEKKKEDENRTPLFVKTRQDLV